MYLRARARGCLQVYMCARGLTHAKTQAHTPTSVGSVYLCVGIVAAHSVEDGDAVRLELLGRHVERVLGV